MTSRLPGMRVSDRALLPRGAGIVVGRRRLPAGGSRITNFGVSRYWSNSMHEFQLTPFLESILCDVKETCAPGLPNWELNLCEPAEAILPRCRAQTGRAS